MAIPLPKKSNSKKLNQSILLPFLCLILEILLYAMLP